MVQMTLSMETPVFLTSRCKSSKFPVLVNRIADPVNSWVIADSIVCNIHQDNLKVLVSRILIDPVRVNNSETSQLSASTLLSNRPLAALELQLGDTLVCGLTIHDTLRNRPLATTPPNTDTVNHITLFGLITQAACLVRASRMVDPNN